MAYLNDGGDQFPDILQFEQTDPVLSGEPNEATGAGLDNIPHMQLARRTRWLKTRVDQLLDTVVNATTNVAGIVRLNNTVTSDSVTQAATANALRLANNNANTRVPDTRAVTGAGLATGGGTLNQNRIITVPKATAQQAVDGVADDVALTPATGRAQIEAILSGGNETAAALVPAGAIMDFAMPTPPNGWLVCDGSQQSRSEHADLFAAIGTTFGPGNGTTTFNLPDFRGEFRRGWDAGRGVDAGRGFGTKQKGTLFVFDQANDGVWVTGTAGTTLTASQLSAGVDSYSANEYPGARAMGAAPIGNEPLPGQNDNLHASGITRPRNIAVLTCIKA
ncbi:phage tail protein [Roseinatronobacter sp. NSM]|uniref:phage tail protein n=1 Tax=Roseinatronobacter sp. NSM TaxID=3457785 RepID=UPI0040373EC2